MGNDEPLKWHLMLQTNMFGEECYLNRNKETGQFHLEDKEENDSYQTAFTWGEITHIRLEHDRKQLFIPVPQEEKQ